MRTTGSACEPRRDRLELRGRTGARRRPAVSALRRSKAREAAQQLSLSRIKKVDTGEVYKVYRDWPELAAKGFEARFSFPEASFKRACVIGMGGSAAGGDIISGWLGPRRDVEFAVYKGSLPPKDMKGTLAIACSASGQTSETIDMMKTAARESATVVCISSGGRLEEEAGALGLEHARMPKLVAPRYMLPFIVFSCLAAANRGLGLGCEEEAGESIDALRKQSKSLDVETPLQRNPPMGLAREMLGKTPAILGDSVTCGVGMRFKNALNENAKTHAYFESMPELFHNEIQAWEGEDGSFIPIFLRHSAEVEKDRRRADAMTRILKRLGNRPIEVRGRGNGILSQLMTMVYHLDMASYYEAIALGRNPLPTKLIDRLKKSA
jgi:glucose/mannose-6-phosphate isomerase